MVGIRINEAGPLLYAALESAAGSLGFAGSALQRWAPLMRSAAAAVEAAEKAHQEAVKHQVNSISPSPVLKNGLC